jgi:chromosome segregation ATPase
MGQDQSQVRAQLSDEEKSPEQLRAEIEDVRGQLGDTAAAIAAKTDVKARARDKADELKRSATAKKDDLLGRSGTSTQSSGRGSAALTQVRSKAEQNPVLVAALGALVGGFALGRLTRRGG